MSKKNVIKQRNDVTFVKYRKLNESDSKYCISNRHAVEKTVLPAILALNVDCFYEIFDWLSLKDLIAIANTCIRIQKMAGDFFQLNYITKSARVENDGIFISSIPANVFSEYIQKVSISGDRLGAYRFIESNCTRSIK